jgi:hypothetical protein
MAVTTTTLAAAMAITDIQISVTAASGFAANQFVLIDQEWLKIVSSYNGTATIIPVLRGQNGSVVAAHAITANVVTDAISQVASSDWANAAASVTTSYPLSGKARVITSYTADGAITLPQAGTDQIAILNGTTQWDMTLANPTKDMDGTFLWVVSNGKAAHTVTYTAGLGNASTGYTVATFTTGSQQSLALMAINGIWMQQQSQFSGTLTAILIALA